MKKCLFVFEIECGQNTANIFAKPSLNVSLKYPYKNGFVIADIIQIKKRNGRYLDRSFPFKIEFDFVKSKLKRCSSREREKHNESLVQMK